MTDPISQPTPQALKADSDALTIQWSDGLTHRLRWAMLRDHCPCATCRAKRAEPPQPAALLPVLSAAEAQPIGALGMRPVGNYAYVVHFNDGHNTGIYSLEYLRELGAESATHEG